MVNPNPRMEDTSVIEHSGLPLPAELMDQMEPLEFFDHRLPDPGNRGSPHPRTIQPILLKQLDGFPHLNDALN